MQFTLDEIKSQDLEYVTINEFIERYHPTLRRESLSYAYKNDKIDYYRPGREIFVVLTEYTKNYRPNNYKGKRLPRQKIKKES